MSVKTNYNDGKWHGWDGGECPIHPESMVTTILRCNDILADKTARDLRWVHKKTAGDIVAFQVTKIHREPREFWLAFDTYYSSKEEAEAANRRVGKAGPIIHVREVIKE